MKKEKIKQYLKFDFIPELKDFFEKNYPNQGFSIEGDFYDYAPQNKTLTKWIVSDGAELNCNLQTLLLDYAYHCPEIILDIDLHYFIKNHVYSR